MSEPAMNQEDLNHFSFPVVTVRYVGPTNYRASRWIARCVRGVNASDVYRATMPYDSGERSGAENALPAARACLNKALHKANADEYIAVPGYLNADSYTFTFVPKYMVA